MAASAPAYRYGEGVPGNRIRDRAKPLRRSATEVVDPIVGVRRQSNLLHPQPNLLRFGPYRDASPSLQHWVGHELVARIAAPRLIWGHAPTVTDHIRRFVRLLPDTPRILLRRRNLYCYCCGFHKRQLVLDVRQEPLWLRPIGKEGAAKPTSAQPNHEFAWFAETTQIKINWSVQNAGEVAQRIQRPTERQVMSCCRKVAVSGGIRI